MKRFRVSYKDINDINKARIFQAEAIDRGLGDAIMNWIDAEYDVDSHTDGTDVWYTDEYGEQVTAMHIENIVEIDPDEAYYLPSGDWDKVCGSEYPTCLDRETAERLAKEWEKDFDELWREASNSEIEEFGVYSG